MLSHVNHLAMFSRFSSLALGQLYHCLNACEAVLKDMGEITHYDKTTQHGLQSPFIGCNVVFPLQSLLTHLSPDKMTAILADNNFKCMLLNENDRIPIPISLKFVPRSPVDNKAGLVHVMAWCQKGDKPMMFQFTNTYMQY